MTICAKPGTKLLQTILAKPWHFTIGCVCNRAAKPGTASPYFFKRLTDLQPWMVQQDALRKPIGLNYTRPDGRTLANDSLGGWLHMWATTTFGIDFKDGLIWSDIERDLALHISRLVGVIIGDVSNTTTYVLTAAFVDRIGFVV